MKTLGEKWVPLKRRAQVELEEQEEEEPTTPYVMALVEIGLAMVDEQGTMMGKAT